MDRGTDTCCKQFHLLIAEAGAVVEAEEPGTPVFCDSGADDFHEAHKRIAEKDICPDDEAAGIVNQRDDIKAFLPIRSFEKRSVAGVAIPDFIDMGTFIATHVFVICYIALFP